MNLYMLDAYINLSLLLLNKNQVIEKNSKSKLFQFYIVNFDYKRMFNLKEYLVFKIYKNNY